jgi:hypothetical protein
MKGSKYVILACVVICALALGGFIQAARAATVPTPHKVTLTPSDPSVIIGKTQAFIATVFDTKGHKIDTVVPLTWALSSAATNAGCSISQNGVLTVLDTAAVATFAKGAVTVEVTATPTILATAGFSIIDTPFEGGVFVGTATCTGTACNGESQDLALDAGKKSFNALFVDSTKGNSQTFSGTIHSNGTITASFKNPSDTSTVTVTGNLHYTDGAVTSISGTWTSTKANNSGTWTTTLATKSESGGKVGTWTIPAIPATATTAKVPGLSGKLAAIFKDDGTIAAVAVQKVNGQWVNGESVPGTWVSNDVTFPSFDELGTAANACTNAEGTYTAADKKATGELLNASAKEVGTWNLTNE